MSIALEALARLPRYREAALRWEEVGLPLPLWLLAVTWFAIALGLTLVQEERGTKSFVSAGLVGLAWGFPAALVVGFAYGDALRLGEFGFVRGTLVWIAVIGASALIYALRERARTGSSDASVR